MSVHPTTAGHPPHTTAERPDPRRWLALGVIALATLMVVLDASVINIALPQAQQSLHISDANRHWAVTAYAVTFGGLLLLGGRLADVLGRKRTMLVALAGFAVASAFGGFAANPAMLVSARALQGIFAAALAPAALSLVTVTFVNPAERARAFGVYGAVQGLGGAIGLLLGGTLTEYLDWRWCLFINVPIAVLAILGAVPTVRESRVTGDRRYDILGAVLATAGSVALVVGFTIAGDGGWLRPTTLLTLGAALALLIGFVLRQARTDHPMLPLRVLTDRNRAGSFATAVLACAGMFGMLLFLTYYLQVNLGYSPIEAGLAFLPFTAGIILMALAMPALLPRTGPKPLMVTGMALATVGMFLLTTINGSPAWLGGALLPELLMGVGLGLVFTPMNSAALTGVDPADAGVASAVLNATQQLGGAFGVALLNTFYTTATRSGLGDDPSDRLGAYLAGYRSAFLAAGVLFIAATAVSLTVLRGRAAREGGANRNAGGSASPLAP
ncbi:MFS transporter [Micromonospora musae]|uniref:MFS transporter n=1 Tax=Micromonospora musae TaxID=1894970 RepID=UPI003430F27F